MVADSPWVHCRFCDQTYIAGVGDRCSLCGKTGGLVEVLPPAPSAENAHQRAWAIPEGTNSATSLAVGCFLAMVGAVVGVGIASAIPEPKLEVAKKPSNIVPVALFSHLIAGAVFEVATKAQEDVHPSDIVPVGLFSRLIAGAFLGGACGGLASAIALLLMARFEGRRRS